MPESAQGPRHNGKKGERNQGQRTESHANRKGTKAAEDSRTPRRCRDALRATPSARSWSAAVLCRFDLRSLPGGEVGLLGIPPLQVGGYPNADSLFAHARSFETFSFGEKQGQSVPWILIGANQTMRHFERTEKLVVCGHESVETGEIFFARGLGI